jgi:DNA (cytosine-5)-methyltransferase 1
MPIKADKSLRAYYNEIDPFAAQWIRNLMAEGWITKGDVDERSIEDVQPNDLTGYDRLHFFAGVAVWDYALNQAGWGRGEIWTGSCPCQPFSAAGKGAGFDDQRHLWPAFHHLIQECKPAIVLGEQVASKDADPWIDLVQADLEAMGYGFGAIPFPSASVGAPHIRDRLYWAADSAGAGSQGGRSVRGARPGREGGATERGGQDGGLADVHSDGCNQAGQRVTQAGNDGSAGDCAACGLADATNERQYGRRASQTSNGRDAAWVEPERLCDAGRSGPVNGFWSDADWLFCRDGKWRPVEPGTFPLVAGAAGGMGRVRADWHTPAGKEGFGHRAGRLKGYGNAINAEAARVFIECVMGVA